MTYSLTATSGATYQDVATTLPAVAWSSPTPTSTSLAPLASGTRDDCADYVLGDWYQSDLGGSYLTSNCHLAAEIMGVTLEDLETWNPSKQAMLHAPLGHLRLPIRNTFVANCSARGQTVLGNASDPACNLQIGVRYCGKFYTGSQPQAEEPSSTLPVRVCQCFVPLRRSISCYSKHPTSMYVLMSVHLSSLGRHDTQLHVNHRRDRRKWQDMPRHLRYLRADHSTILCHKPKRRGPLFWDVGR